MVRCTEGRRPYSRPLAIASIIAAWTAMRPARSSGRKLIHYLLLRRIGETQNSDDREPRDPVPEHAESNHRKRHTVTRNSNRWERTDPGWPRRASSPDRSTRTRHPPDSQKCPSSQRKKGPPRIWKLRFEQVWTSIASLDLTALLGCAGRESTAAAS